MHSELRKMEHVVHEILGRRIKNGIMQWYVIWAKPCGELYTRGTHAWQPRHCFVDEDDENSVVSVNAAWLDSERQNPCIPGLENVAVRPFDATRDIRGTRNRKKYSPIIQILCTC